MYIMLSAKAKLVTPSSCPTNSSIHLNVVMSHTRMVRSSETEYKRLSCIAKERTHPLWPIKTFCVFSCKFHSLSIDSHPATTSYPSHNAMLLIASSEATIASYIICYSKSTILTILSHHPTYNSYSSNIIHDMGTEN